MKEYYIYILANQRNTVFYTGITNNLVRRVYEHRNKLTKGFTEKYNISILLYYEQTVHPLVAIKREKQIKDMRRERKLELIRKMNPDMNDLYDSIVS